MKNNRPYWKIMLMLWETHEWIENEDFRLFTHGSPKFTSRISDMRKKGIEIVSRKSSSSNNFEYKLITPRSEVIRIMSARKAA